MGIPQGTVLAYKVLQLGMRRITGARGSQRSWWGWGQLLSKGQEEREGGCFLVGLSIQVAFVAGFQARSQGGPTTPPVPSLPQGVGMGPGHWT